MRTSGNPPLPPIPGDRFRGTLRNPAIDSCCYAAQYTRDQEVRSIVHDRRVGTDAVPGTGRSQEESA